MDHITRVIGDQGESDVLALCGERGPWRSMWVLEGYLWAAHRNFAAVHSEPICGACKNAITGIDHLSCTEL